MGSMQGRYGALQRMVTQGDVILVHPIATSDRWRPSQAASQAEPAEATPVPESPAVESAGAQLAGSQAHPVETEAPLAETEAPPGETAGDAGGWGWPRTVVNAPGIVQWNGPEPGEQKSEPTYQVAPPGYAIEFGTGRLVPLNRHGLPIE